MQQIINKRYSKRKGKKKSKIWKMPIEEFKEIMRSALNFTIAVHNESIDIKLMFLLLAAPIAFSSRLIQ